MSYEINSPDLPKTLSWTRVCPDTIHCLKVILQEAP